MSGPQCCENPPVLSSSCGAGSVAEIGGLKAYFTGPPDSKLVILLVSDILGYEAPNLRKLADKVAAAGFYVVVPDFFHGDPFVPETKTLPVWIKSHGPDKGFEDVKPIIAALRSKGINSIGAAGFCWGAKVVVELAKAGDIQAAVLLHPSFTTVDDIKDQEFREDISWVAHGWAVRYKVDDEEAVKRAEEAQQNMMDWHASAAHITEWQLLPAAADKDGEMLAVSVTLSFTLLDCEKEMSGPQCCENPPTLSSSSGAGCVTEIGGLKAYVSGPSDSKLAILLISDVYGYEAPNLRNLADKVAGAGFYVVVPDFFYGDPFLPETNIPVWIKAHGTDKGFEDAKPIIAELRSKGINAIGAAGFCWGAKVAVELSKAGHIQAAVLLHPSFVTVDDIKGTPRGTETRTKPYVQPTSSTIWASLDISSPLTEVKAPIAILGAEIDQYSPPKLLKQFEEVLSTKPEVNGYVKIFPGVDHGWSVRYKVEDEEAVKQANEAHQNMMDWFTQKKRTTCLIQWCENPPTLSSSCGGGSVVEVGSLKANVAGPSDSKHSILLVADIFGDYPLNHSSNPHDSCFYFILHIT
ncbi:Endo-1,3;1,4-beta-D-glucanase [Vitis vinifera]|uniref:Endo-1,31,4-beta-D-glucanase n=1 Tax=Vitis vinifera TaxID=29760 RepID=A0A438KHI8_VITVI|nr:Endo-1,3;1,4-beta-D-glucanase [Vitis vinifera]